MTELWPVAAAVRRFLEQRWSLWPGVERNDRGAFWGNCGRASRFLQRVLRDECALPAQFQSGNPLSAGVSNPGAGYRSSAGWRAHAWVLAGPWIADVTHDQFDDPAISIVAMCSPDYRVSPDIAWDSAKAARLALCAALWPAWLVSPERQALFGGDALSG
jgi:hypothetical protein